MKKEFNHEKIKEAIRTILTELGDDYSEEQKQRQIEIDNENKKLFGE